MKKQLGIFALSILVVIVCTACEPSAEELMTTYIAQTQAYESTFSAFVQQSIDETVEAAAPFYTAAPAVVGEPTDTPIPEITSAHGSGDISRSTPTSESTPVPTYTETNTPTAVPSPTITPSPPPTTTPTTTLLPTPPENPLLYDGYLTQIALNEEDIQMFLIESDVQDETNISEFTNDWIHWFSLPSNLENYLEINYEASPPDNITWWIRYFNTSLVFSNPEEAHQYYMNWPTYIGLRMNSVNIELIGDEARAFQGAWSEQPGSSHGPGGPPFSIIIWRYNEVCVFLAMESPLSLWPESLVPIAENIQARLVEIMD